MAVAAFWLPPLAPAAVPPPVLASADTPAVSATAVAWAPDGLVEAVEYRVDGAAWTCGVQWHPERKIEELTGTNRRLFEVFGQEVRRASSHHRGE